MKPRIEDRDGIFCFLSIEPSLPHFYSRLTHSFFARPCDLALTSVPLFLKLPGRREIGMEGGECRTAGVADR